MRGTRLVGITAGTLLYITAFLFSQPPEPAVSLQKEVESLRRQVVELERRLSALERSQAKGPAAVPNLPPGTQEREFNGMRFYLVPVH